MKANKKYVASDDYQYAMYPNPVMQITQTVNGGYTHMGTNDIDDAQENTGRSNGYAPCDMVCVATDYVNGNAIFWQSQNKVHTPKHGLTYIYMMVIHDSTANAYVGMKVSQGQQLFTEGVAGEATGNHNHLSFGVGKYPGYMYTKNSYGVYMMPGNVNPAEVVYVDDTTIMNGGGLAWQKIPKTTTTTTTKTFNEKDLVQEDGIATLTVDQVAVRQDNPYNGTVVKRVSTGYSQRYYYKWIGNGHRYVVWKENNKYMFMAVSGSETQGQDPWATFSSIETNTEPSQPSDTITLIEENGVATLTVDGVRARLNSPTGNVVRTYNTGDKIEYTHKYIGNGHRYIVWTEGNNKIFLAVAGTEDRSDMWATFGSVEDDISEPVDYTKNVKGYGVDISQHNGEDFDVSKYDFVIIRASYGTNKDKLFDTYVQKCKDANIPYGVYCYSYALDNEGAKAEGEFILDLIKDKDIALGVWYDMEDADGYKAKNNALTKDKLTSFCKIFCDVVHSQGYYTGVYSTKHWFETLCPTDYPKWVANWGTNDGTVQADFSDYAVMHQYSANPIDKDVIFYDIEFYESTPIKQGQDEPQETVEDTKEKIDTKKLNSLISLLIKLVEKLLSIFK